MKCKDCPKMEECRALYDLKKRRAHCPIAQDRQPPEPQEEPRQCSLFYCDHVGERRCCRHCHRYDRCLNKCLNHPSRCGYATVKAQGKARGTIKSLS